MAMKRPPELLTAPWLISSGGAAVCWAVWSRGELFADVLAKARAERPGPYANQSGAMRVENRVAIISVTGPIFRRASLFSELSGATTDEQIRAALAQATLDPSVDAIVLDIDSPGGEAAGACETAQAIRAADAIKPVVAYTGATAASKAYWFLSACRLAVAAKDAQVGCIGARRTFVDDSVADERNGVKTHDIVSDISPAKRNYPVDDEVLANVQRSVDEIGLIFAEDVALGRRASLDHVVANFGRGDCISGRQGLAVGMVDELGTLQSAMGLAMSEAMRRPAARLP
jgi:ClpP class serine protease